jgi:coniferyl-aldehyde dehydrogenase
MDIPEAHSTMNTDLRTDFDRLRAAQLKQIPGARERLYALKRLREAIQHYKEQIVTAIGEDFGRRSRIETMAADVMVSLEEIKYAEKHLRAWMKPERRSISLTFKPARAEIRFLPLGVVGVVAPWNYPFQLAIIPLVNAIAAGNRVMVKPSEFTPRTSALLHKMLGEVFSENEVVVVQGGADVGAAFTALPFDHLLFTGSTAVGRHVMTAAAANLTPVTLELGGKSPALIAPDYPIEHAAKRIATGKCFNAGQTCVAPDYVLVPREKRDAFAKLYLEAVKKRYPSLVDNQDATSIVNERQASRLRAWLEDARQRGVAVQQYLPDGEKTNANFEMVAPTVLLDPPDEALVMQHEIFGPLLPIKSYDNHDEAIAYILQRDRPLAFYPFDRQSARLNKTLDTVVAGSVCVNDTIIQFGQHNLPIGGVGPSGMGHYHGYAGFLTFSKSMPVMYQSRINGMGLFDPPYGKIAHWLVKFLTR